MENDRASYAFNAADQFAIYDLTPVSCFRLKKHVQTKVYKLQAENLAVHPCAGTERADGRLHARNRAAFTGADCAGRDL